MAKIAPKVQNMTADPALPEPPYDWLRTLGFALWAACCCPLPPALPAGVSRMGSPYADVSKKRLGAMGVWVLQPPGLATGLCCCGCCCGCCGRFAPKDLLDAGYRGADAARCALNAPLKCIDCVYGVGVTAALCLCGLPFAPKA